MANIAEITGRVIFVPKGRSPTTFRVYGFSSKKNYNCSCPKFCPLQVGDLIHGSCQILSSDALFFPEAPRVELPTDKPSILGVLAGCSKGSGFGDARALKLYDRLIENDASNSSTSSDPDINPVCRRLDRLSVLYFKTSDEHMLDLYTGIATRRQMTKILTFWYKSRILRALYLMGLNNKEIRSIETYCPLDEIYSRLIKNPYTLFELSLDKCDAIFAKLGRVPSEELRAGAIITRRISDMMTQKAWIGVPTKILNQAFPDLANRLQMLRDEYGIVFYNSTAYLPYYHEAEVAVAEKVEKLLATPLKKVDTINLENTILTEEQRAAVRGALTCPISIITGSAGTGKSTIQKEIIANLEHRGISYAITSFTGKAVARIAEVIKKRSPSTMNRMIVSASTVEKFSHLIIDESSMVTMILLYEFLKTFDFPYSITFIGDCNQLEPIGPGSLLSELIKCNRIPIFYLNKVHRTGPGSGVLVNTTAMLQADGSDGKGFNFQPFDDFTLSTGGVQEVFAIVSSLKRCGAASTDVTVICPYNRELKVLNDGCQEIFCAGNKGITDSRGVTFYEGDRCIMTINRSIEKIMNGEEGIVTHVEKDAITVAFRDNNVQLFSTDCSTGGPNSENEDDSNGHGKLNTMFLRHSFALTVHLLQGSEFKFIIFYIPNSGSSTVSAFLNKPLVYTGLTRAKKAVWVIGDVMALTIAAVRPPAYRCNNLAQRLLKIDVSSSEPTAETVVTQF